MSAGGGVPWSAAPAFFIVGTLTLGGLTGVVRTSLREGVLGERGIGFGAWERVLRDPAFVDAVGFTLWIAAASTALSVIGAVALSSVLRPSRWAGGALGLPVASPHLVAAAVAVVWLAPGGIVDRVVETVPVDVIGHRAGIGIIMVYVFKELPFLTLLALAALDEATAELDDTAALLGASRWRRLRDVVAPRLFLPLAAAGFVVASFVIGAVEVPLLVGPTRPDMIGPYALDAVRIDGPLARADAAVAELVAAGIVAFTGTGLAAVVWRRRHR